MSFNLFCIVTNSSLPPIPLFAELSDSLCCVLRTSSNLSIFLWISCGFVKPPVCRAVSVLDRSPTLDNEIFLPNVLSNSIRPLDSILDAFLNLSFASICWSTARFIASA